MMVENHPLVGRYVFDKTGASLLGRVLAVAFHPAGVYPRVPPELQKERSDAVDDGREPFPRWAGGECRVTPHGDTQDPNEDRSDGRGFFVVLVEAQDGLLEEHAAVHLFVDDERAEREIEAEHERAEAQQRKWDEDAKRRATPK